MTDSSVGRVCKPASRCPCSSGKSYRECCLPYHRGHLEPPTAEALMRSRYSAFATMNGEYLLKTLTPDHEDRQRVASDMVRLLRQHASEHRYPGLAVLEVNEGDEEAWVTFRARIFRKGQDQSFTERARFQRKDGVWRYCDGTIVDSS